ncbi:MAG: ATP synthase epsilon chain [Candidatus Uhrbacteria bacterium GW2011_GWE2_40_58]|nr:MAG: ATP synthase epsilon chain [Candidatus Uhrbacteria bacterium GW2011_GWF2_40_263]KKR67807.1 MAG: ATP synthase epsilon chain [Candidatus Uhrbacteria bacterium GW2011_GWE2_40_58]OGL94514.1 MAG: ATP synthase F1 subunit epsilon [Candidatus Uhrbacteria bacterium RIFOXYA2_FULL_40_9]OGL96765.1 MAG: ATP synthase F1 subunit epsilon [Candidatus Uhrbacteria bacterium RIFOXYB2_FULL_41_18]HBK34481.1 ATP synthase F1 subunit epsilon [Candidatus Uhrbacteria bacterium]
MTSRLMVKVLTPERLVFEDTVDSLTAMTQVGEITILPGHAPLVSNLKAGDLVIKKDGIESHLVASTGFLEVSPNHTITILADTAERVEELELEKIEQAKERAKDLLHQARDKDDVAFAHAAAMLEREMARHKAFTKRKYRDLKGFPKE